MEKNAALAALGITNLKREDEINPLRLAVIDEFEHDRKDKDGKHIDYRDAAIDRCVKAKVPFWSEANTAYDLMKRYVRLACPHCDKNMSVVDGGGSSITTSITYHCKACNIRASLTTLSDGGIGFREND